MIVNDVKRMSRARGRVDGVEYPGDVVGFVQCPFDAVRVARGQHLVNGGGGA